MGPDVFIPEWLVTLGERPPAERDVWLIPGASAGAPAEVAARQAFMDTAWVPSAAPLPAKARRWGLALLDALPEWNGAILWLVLAGSVVAFRRGGSALARAMAVLFWTALIFPVIVHGPLPRYYTALVPLALWLALGLCPLRRASNCASCRRTCRSDVRMPMQSRLTRTFALPP